MINTILFDLDGTLLPMDMELFMKHYFYQMGLHFKDKIEGSRLASYIMESTDVMIRDQSKRSNEDVFMTHFATLVDDIDQYKSQFLEFYQTTFDLVQVSTSRSEQMRQSVDLLKEKGYTIAIATNPLFPMVANQKRIQWAGFDPQEFSYISCFEENHSCKPHLSYYEEVLANVNKKPEECLMVGNDIGDDLSIRKLGVQTYLVTDHMLNRSNQPYTTDYEGTYNDFYQFVQSLPVVK